MTAVLLPTLVDAFRTVGEKGVAMIALFTVLGTTMAAATVFLPGLAQVSAVLLLPFWIMVVMIACNLFVEAEHESRGIQYANDYHGLLWTTGNTLAGLIAYTLLLTATSSVLLITILLAPPSFLLEQLSHRIDPVLVAIGVIQIGSSVPPLFVAARAILFPVFIAVNNKPVVTAFRRSFNATRPTAWQVVPLIPLIILLLTAAPFAGSLVAVWTGSWVQAQTSLPFLPAIVAGAVQSVFTATGHVVVIALITSLYNRLTA